MAEFGLKRSTKVSGRSLWELAKGTMLSLKKAMAFMRKLDNIIVEADANSHRVIGYMSGKNEDSFFKAIINGMWQLHQSKKNKKKRTAIEIGKLLYVCGCPNVEVLVTENNAKVANWYKVYIQEVR